MIKSILFTCLICCATLLFGQNSGERIITGTVIGFDGEGLAAASIGIVGKSKGTTADLDGNFKILVGKEDVLRISYTGFQMLELYPEEIEYELNGQVVLQSGLWLQEVVITAYHTKAESTHCCSYIYTTSCCECTSAIRKAVNLDMVERANVPSCKTWRYYPNPTTEGVMVETEDAIGLISVFSSDGKMIKFQPITDVLTRVDLMELPTGIYFLNYENEDWAQAIGKVSVVRQ